MPKVKTPKTIAKRVKVTKSGKILVRRRSGQHLVSRLSKRTTKSGGRLVQSSQAMAKIIKFALGGH